MMFKKQHPPSTYIVGLGFFLFLVFSTTIGSLFFLKSKLSQHHETILSSTQDLIPAMRLRSALENAVASDRGFLLTGRLDFIDRLEASVRDFENQLIELKSRARTVEDERLIAVIEKETQEHHDALEHLLALRTKDGMSDQALAVLKEQVFPERFDVQDSVRALVDYKEQVSTKMETDSRAASAKAATRTIIVTSLSLMLLIWLSLLLSRKLAFLYEESKKSEKKIQKLARELARSNAELERFASVASHDLRSPLNTLTSFGTLLQERAQNWNDPESEKFLGHITRGAKKMRELIDNLINYAQVNNGKITSQSVSLEELMKEIKSGLQTELAMTKTVLFYEDLPELVGDPIQLRQLFQNLIANSIRYRSSESPLIRIIARDKGSQWEISVKDNGIGMDMKHTESIFKPFIRLHSHDDRPGTGLGLTICKSVVERHGGKIWVRSEKGMGTEFFFTLPKVSAQMDKLGS